MGHAQRRFSVGKGLAHGPDGGFGAVILFAEMGQYYMAKVGSTNLCQKIARVLVGKMPTATADPLFQVPGIRSGLQHARIMIGFQNHGVAGPEMHLDHGRGNAQVRCNAEFQMIPVYGESGRILGIVGKG